MLRGAAYIFELWGLPHQLPPEGDWTTWVILGGRGAGKTRAGAEWIRAQVEGTTPVDKGKAQRVALIGETLDQVREVMIFGDSGIMSCTPEDRRPHWNATRKCLEWANGAEAFVVSASNPESLRGPQFDAAWLDEFAKWKKARAAWDMLQFALRLGKHPRAVVTTTPRPQPLLLNILERERTVMTHAPSEANHAHLSQGFVESLRQNYGGSRLGRQEIDGELLFDIEDALWSYEMLEAASVKGLPTLDRIVVAVDPPASSGPQSDECGIIVAGATYESSPDTWRAYVIHDASVAQARPHIWARAVAEAYAKFDADLIVAEVNQGGDMVEAVLRQEEVFAPFKAVRASKGKTARAEPISALYEQGRVKHAGQFDALEEQLLQMSLSGFQGKGSPDRADALVWALSELMVERAKSYRNPRVRSI
ncbi:MAG: terminase family protein [Pseudomonadota bacterium]